MPFVTLLNSEYITNKETMTVMILAVFRLAISHGRPYRSDEPFPGDAVGSGSSGGGTIL